MSKKNKKAVIIGAGPTGLATAYKLVKDGWDVLVVEKSTSVGGICKTIKYKDISVDLGPHRFTPHTKKIKKFAFDLLSEKIITRPQKSHILLWGKFMEYPLNFSGIIKSVNPVILVKTAISYAINLFKNLLGSEPPKSYKQQMELNFGPFLAKNIFCPIAEKTWGEKAENLSKDLAAQRVALESLFKVALNVVFKKSPKSYKENLTPPQQFYYFKGGFGKFTDAMAEEIKKSGGKILTECCATKIETQDGLCKKVVFQKDGKEQSVECDFVMATNPITQVVEQISPEIEDAEAKKAATKLKFANLLLAFVVVKKPKVGSDIAIFFPDRKFVFGRIFEQKNFDESMLPKEKTVIGVEITCTKKDKIWPASDTKIKNTIVSQLIEAGIIKKSDVVDFFCIRLENVYPVYDLEYKRNLEIIIQALDKYPNLIINGRPGLFMYNNFHHSLDMGFAAADYILSGYTNAVWKKERKRFDSFKIVE